MIIDDDYVKPDGAVLISIEESEMEGLTPPNSPKYCRSCILFAGLKSMMLKIYLLNKILSYQIKNQDIFIYLENKTK